MAKIVKETIHAKGIDIGIYTTNFENEYEALGNLRIIPVALNNIKYRTDINVMNTIEKNVNSLED